MIARRAKSKKSPINITTIQFHEDFKDFIQKAHIDYINYCAEQSSRVDSPSRITRMYVSAALDNLTFGTYLHDWFDGRYVVFECMPPRKHPEKPGQYARPVNLAGKSFFSNEAVKLGYNLDE